MNIEQFEKEQSEMSDDELIVLCQEEISKLCKTGGRSFVMSVPPRIKDTDMLFVELMKRYISKL